jgi:hypothetical protein
MKLKYRLPASAPRSQRKAKKARMRRLNDWMPRFAAYSYRRDHP